METFDKIDDFPISGGLDIKTCFIQVQIVISFTQIVLRIIKNVRIYQFCIMKVRIDINQDETRYKINGNEYSKDFQFVVFRSIDL